MPKLKSTLEEWGAITKIEKGPGGTGIVVTFDRIASAKSVLNNAQYHGKKLIGEEMRNNKPHKKQETDQEESSPSKISIKPKKGRGFNNDDSGMVPLLSQFDDDEEVESAAQRHRSPATDDDQDQENNDDIMTDDDDMDGINQHYKDYDDDSDDIDGENEDLPTEEEQNDEDDHDSEIPVLPKKASSFSMKSKSTSNLSNKDIPTTFKQYQTNLSQEPTFLFEQKARIPSNWKLQTIAPSNEMDIDSISTETKIDHESEENQFLKALQEKYTDPKVRDTSIALNSTIRPGTFAGSPKAVSLLPKKTPAVKKTSSLSLKMDTNGEDKASVSDVEPEEEEEDGETEEEIVEHDEGESMMSEDEEPEEQEEAEEVADGDQYMEEDIDENQQESDHNEEIEEAEDQTMEVEEIEPPVKANLKTSKAKVPHAPKEVIEEMSQPRNPQYMQVSLMNTYDPLTGGQSIFEQRNGVWNEKQAVTPYWRPAGGDEAPPERVRTSNMLYKSIVKLEQNRAAYNGSEIENLNMYLLDRYRQILKELTQSGSMSIISCYIAEVIVRSTLLMKLDLFRRCITPTALFEEERERILKGGFEMCTKLYSFLLQAAIRCPFHVELLSYAILHNIRRSGSLEEQLQNIESIFQATKRFKLGAYMSSQFFQSSYMRFVFDVDSAISNLNHVELKRLASQCSDIQLALIVDMMPNFQLRAIVDGRKVHNGATPFTYLEKTMFIPARLFCKALQQIECPLDSPCPDWKLGPTEKLLQKFALPRRIDDLATEDFQQTLRGILNSLPPTFLKSVTNPTPSISADQALNVYCRWQKDNMFERPAQTDWKSTKAMKEISFDPQPNSGRESSFITPDLTTIMSSNKKIQLAVHPSTDKAEQPSAIKKPPPPPAPKKAAPTSAAAAPQLKFEAKPPTSISIPKGTADSRSMDLKPETREAETPIVVDPKFSAPPSKPLRFTVPKPPIDESNQKMESIEPTEKAETAKKQEAKPKPAINFSGSFSANPKIFVSKPVSDSVLLSPPKNIFKPQPTLQTSPIKSTIQPPTGPKRIILEDQTDSSTFINQGPIIVEARPPMSPISKPTLILPPIAVPASEVPKYDESYLVQPIPIPSLVGIHVARQSITSKFRKSHPEYLTFKLLISLPKDDPTKGTSEFWLQKKLSFGSILPLETPQSLCKTLTLSKSEVSFAYTFPYNQSSLDWLGPILHAHLNESPSARHLTTVIKQMTSTPSDNKVDNLTAFRELKGTQGLLFCLPQTKNSNEVPNDVWWSEQRERLLHTVECLPSGLKLPLLVLYFKSNYFSDSIKQEDHRNCMVEALGLINLQHVLSKVVTFQIEIDSIDLYTTKGDMDSSQQLETILTSFAMITPENPPISRTSISAELVLPSYNFISESRHLFLSQVSMSASHLSPLEPGKVINNQIPFSSSSINTESFNYPTCLYYVEFWNHQLLELRNRLLSDQLLLINWPSFETSSLFPESMELLGWPYWDWNTPETRQQIEDFLATFLLPVHEPREGPDDFDPSSVAGFCKSLVQNHPILSSFEEWFIPMNRYYKDILPTFKAAAESNGKLALNIPFPWHLTFDAIFSYFMDRMNETVFLPSSDVSPASDTERAMNLRKSWLMADYEKWNQWYLNLCPPIPKDPIIEAIKLERMMDEGALTSAILSQFSPSRNVKPNPLFNPNGFHSMDIVSPKPIGNISMPSTPTNLSSSSAIKRLSLSPPLNRSVATSASVSPSPSSSLDPTRQISSLEQRLLAIQQRLSRFEESRTANKRKSESNTGGPPTKYHKGKE